MTIEFYAPATFQFSTEPGRIERFLERILGRGEFWSRSPAGANDGFDASGLTRDVTRGIERRSRPR